MRFRYFTAAVVALCSLAGWGVWASQQASTTANVPAALVRLKVIITPGVPATLAVHNGEMARLTMPDGSQYGLTPVVTKGDARLYLFRITPGATPSSERLEQLARLPMSVDVASGYPTEDPLFEVTLLGIEFIAAGPTPAASPAEPDAPCVRCCVTCDGVTACACAVQMDCGSCCCKDQCTCPGEAAAAAGCAIPSRGESPSVASGRVAAAPRAYRTNQ